MGSDTMAIVKYQISGQIIDFSDVINAIEKGALLECMIAIDKALAPFKEQHPSAALVLYQQVSRTGRLPDELEIENIITSNQLPSTQHQEVHPNFPMEKKCRPHCPVCGSAEVERLGAGTRAAAGFLFGLFSSTARSQFHCKSCGYKF